MNGIINEKDVENLTNMDGTYKGTIDGEISFGDALGWNEATIDQRRPLAPLWMGRWRRGKRLVIFPFVNVLRGRVPSYTELFGCFFLMLS